jgi:hypothetical protein
MQVQFQGAKDSFKMNLKEKIMDKERNQVLIGKLTSQMKKIGLTVSAKLSLNLS